MTEKSSSLAKEQLKINIDPEFHQIAIDEAGKRGMSVDQFVENATSIYSANLLQRFMRGFLLLVCIGNVIACIPACFQQMSWLEGTGMGMGVGIAVIAFSGVPCAIALLPLLRRESKGYVLGFAAMLIFAVWTFVEVDILGCTPNGWPEFLATGASGKNLGYALVGAASALGMIILDRKNNGRMMA